MDDNTSEDTMSGGSDYFQKLASQSNETYGWTLSERFLIRALELAREGVLGKLKTRKASLQNSYAQLVSLLDNTAMPILIYGEKGTGKRRLVKEYAALQNFYKRLDGAPTGQLKVFNSEFLASGFSQQFLNPATSNHDVVFIENVDKLKVDHQIELLEHLKMREQWSRENVVLPRMMFSTPRALSLAMINGQFKRELFQAITTVAVFLPSLDERQEDLPEIIASTVERILGKKANPDKWFYDFISRQILASNLDDLEKILRNMISRKPDIRSWKPEDLPAPFTPSSFKKPQLEDYGRQRAERNRIRRSLIKTGGDRVRAAHELGIDKVEFLKKMMQLGLR